MAVIREAWAMYKAHWQHFLPLAFVYFVLLSLITLVLTLLFGWVGAIANALVSLIGYFWLQGALVEAVADVRDGRADLTIQDTFRKARPQIFTLLGAGILAGIGIVIGLILLIVPGLILLTWWCLIAAVIVLERVGVMESFGRSRELVRGNGWNVFGVLVIMLLILIVVSFLVSLVFVWLPEEVRNYVSSVVSNTLLIPFLAIALTLVYFRLARMKEGVEHAPPPTPAG